MKTMKTLLLAGLLAMPAAAIAGDAALIPVTDTTGAPAAIGQPPAGKGQIVFFRPAAMGMALGCTVHEGDQLVSRLANSHYFVYTAPLGAHTFTVESEAKDTLNMEVEDGETYYVKCKIGMGIIAGRPNISPSDKAAFDAKAPNLKLQKLAVADKTAPSETAAKN